MKKTTLAALIIAAAIITFISCKWFQSKQQPTSFNIVGNWKTDSVYYAGKDSSKPSLIALVFIKKDSTFFKFNADSTFSTVFTKDTTTEKYYVKDSILYIKEDSSFLSNHLIVQNDSLISISTKDSLVFVLRKQ
jgi:hypothetical protein